MNKYEENRNLMKSQIGDIDYKLSSDMSLGVAQPSFQKTIPNNAPIINLLEINSETAPKADFFNCTSNRISRRLYSDKTMSLFELSFLLWCTQGVKKVIGGYRKYLKDGSGRNYLRPVASAGNSYETYLSITNVEGVQNRIWRYLPLSHQIVFLKSVENLQTRISETFTNPSQNQSYTSKAAVVFFWACTPYKGEWAGGNSYKNMLLELGYISHQLYLATEALGCGCCAIAGYYQGKADELIGVDGIDEFTVLCSSVGYVIPEEKNWVERYPDARINTDFYK